MTDHARRMRARLELQNSPEWSVANELQSSPVWQCAVTLDSHTMRAALVDAAAARHVAGFPSTEVTDRTWNDAQKAMARVREAARMLHMLQ